MGRYNYSEDEERLNKVLKMNQDMSDAMLNDNAIKETRQNADNAIASSMELLKSLGIDRDLKISTEARNEKLNITRRSYDEITAEADKLYDYVELEDILTPLEIQKALDDLKRIEKEFSKKTSIVNKTDLSFLVIATALQTAKALITPHIASKFGYGEGFDPNERLPHDDKSIKDEHHKANDKFSDKFSKRYSNGYWIEMLYQSVPYDAIKGSADIGLGLNGNNHRLKTLGHDPVLGWLFGTANILTDVITLNNFSSYRVERKPDLHITNEPVLMSAMFADAIAMTKNHKMNLPAALFAQAQHLKSDEYTKRGLPVPILSTLNEDFASKLYNEHYDALCLARDMKIVGASAAVSVLINLIVGLIHGLFYNSESGISRDLYEVRTRKILLISNSIASTSSIIYSVITKNPKNLDIGGLLVTISRLFSDIRFIAKIKQEYIENEIQSQLMKEIDKLDEIEASFVT